MVMAATTHTPFNNESPGYDAQDLQNVFTENLKMGVPFRDCFMLVLGLSGHTQASLMRSINRTQSCLSQHINGHRRLGAPVPPDLKKACRHELGFNPWDFSALEQRDHG